MFESWFLSKMSIFYPNHLLSTDLQIGLVGVQLAQQLLGCAFTAAGSVLGAAQAMCVDPTTAVLCGRALGLAWRLHSSVKSRQVAFGTQLAAIGACNERAGKEFKMLDRGAMCQI